MMRTDGGPRRERRRTEARCTSVSWPPEPPRISKPKRKYLQQAERIRLQETVADHPRDRMIVETFLITGIRVSELTDLNVGDFDPQTRQLTVRREKKRDADNVDIIKLEANFSKLLNRFIAQKKECGKDVSSEAPLFLSVRNERLTRKGIHEMIRKRGREAKIRGRVYPHMLRYTAARRVLSEHNGDKGAVQRFLSHNNAKTTDGYLK